MPAPPTPAELRAAREGSAPPAPPRPTPAPTPPTPAPSPQPPMDTDAAVKRIASEMQASTEAIRQEIQEVATAVRKLYQLILRLVVYSAIFSVLSVLIGVFARSCG